ncbi:hypothetical protein B0F90DRAFT_1670566 [Multifurca ochricompacta]|uniref:F-box domain-containing protein n=1 Tax=Multifurca ochricompacta TaxID=376703 RepID=A0AAD4LZQ5_9AGAM|nr:hypothetical protein B0F90DRAFT_1670566 [Multifurca ochricompacta]
MHPAIQKLNEDLLIEIFEACRLDNLNPDNCPRGWWYNLAHVCRKWRRVVLSSPTRLGLTLVCKDYTPVAVMLANSPPLPLVIYWRTPSRMTNVDFEEALKGIILALQHRDRVETLASAFEAPSLCHLLISEFVLLPMTLLHSDATRLVTFALGEITSPTQVSPEYLVERLLLMPHLKVLKIGYLSAVKTREVQGGEDPSDIEMPQLTLLANLEEVCFRGSSSYFDGLVARISAPALKKLSVTLTSVQRSFTLPRLSRFISEVEDLSFRFARVRFQDTVSIVMDHDDLWTGRGAFEISFDLDRKSRPDLDLYVACTAKICSTLSTMPSDVRSLLIEDAHGLEWSARTTSTRWNDLLGLFDGVKTLRVAHLLVDELAYSLQPDEKGSIEGLLPKLEEIVCYGSTNEFTAFVEARRLIGRPKTNRTLPKRSTFLYVPWRLCIYLAYFCPISRDFYSTYLLLPKTPLTLDYLLHPFHACRFVIVGSSRFEEILLNKIVFVSLAHHRSKERHHALQWNAGLV